MEIDVNTLIGIGSSAFFGVTMLIIGINIGNPKLIVCGRGGGGGGNPDSVHGSHVTIHNSSSFLGLKLDRKPAMIQQAFIIDNRTKERQCLPCNWIVAGQAKTDREVSIDAGDQKSIVLFVKRRGQDEYYVCNGDSRKIPENSHAFIEQENEFTLILRDAIGREYNFDFFVSNKSSGLQILSAIRFAERLTMIKRASHMFFSAIKPGKFR